MNLQPHSRTHYDKALRSRPGRRRVQPLLACADPQKENESPKKGAQEQGKETKNCGK
jgi:hypothetical protein